MFSDHREHKQYYYSNNQTGVSQWDYPLEAGQLEDEKEGGSKPSAAETESRSLFNQASLMEGMEHGKYIQPSAVMVPPVQEVTPVPAYNALVASTATQETAVVAYTNYSTQYTDPIPPLPAAPAPPLPEPTPPPSLTSKPNPPLPSTKTKPPPPPPGTELFPPLPDSPPPPLPSGSGPELPPLPSSPPPPPPPPEDDRDGVCDSTRTMTPPPLPLPNLSASEMLTGIPGDLPTSTTVSANSAVIGKPQMLYSAPTSTIGSGPGMVADVGYTAPVLYSAPPAVAAPPLSGPSTTSAQPPAKTKKKKDKTKTKSTSKKNKLPLSLVQKWQQIKEEVEREEIADEEDEEEDDDPTVATQKRIDQWKKEQLAAGLSTKNANFEMIQGNWRERLKKKSSQNT